MRTIISLPLTIIILLILTGCEALTTEEDAETSEHTNQAPTIEITGDAHVSMEIGETYNDAGATASDAEDGDLTDSIQTTSNVDTSVAGSYQVSYTVTDSDGLSDQVSRSVQVNETAATEPETDIGVNSSPTIEITGDTTVDIEQGVTYNDPGAKASDAEDGDLTGEIRTTSNVNTSIVGTYWVYYAVSDSDGASAQATRSVLVYETVTSEPENTVPTISINGNPLVSIELGAAYNDQGAVAEDAEDGDLTDQIVTTSEVNTAIAGTYQVSYTVVDSDGSSAQAVRTVEVLIGTNRGSYPVSWESNFSIPPQDANGWSILTPSADSRLIYISSSEGDDDTAQFYEVDDSEIGSDPFAPVGSVAAYATIDAALSQMRKGYPDYVLLKRGDSWRRGSFINPGAGRSATERAVLSAYGALTDDRPLVENAGLFLNTSSYLAVVGIHFRDTKRNPDSAEFVGFDAVGGGNGIGATVYSAAGGLLFEDCWFEWFSGNVIQSWAFDSDGNKLSIPDIIVRRNIFNNNYSVSSHSQGLYSFMTSMLLEENIFDHNGWYQQRSGASTSEGQATIFNHNTYFGHVHDTIFRNNIFLRASSISTKFTSNTTSGTNRIFVRNLLLDNNFYAEGEVGISLGGNKDQNNGPRWDNILVTNNVLTGIGRSFPTNRGLGWGIEISDWNSGLVSDNLMSNWGESGVYTNTWGIKSTGHVTDTIIDSNIIYNLYSTFGVLSFTDAGVSGAQNRIVVSNNEIAALYETKGRIIDYTIAPTQQEFSDNYYYFAKDQSQWFNSSSGRISLTDFMSLSEDTNSVAELREYVAPERSITTYLNALGYASGLNDETEIPALVERLKQQRKGNWDENLTATAINNFFRNGFCIVGNSSCR